MSTTLIVRQSGAISAPDPTDTGGIGSGTADDDRKVGQTEIVLHVEWK